ncbi:2-oxoisovalerate dehydrogenase E2 component (dihydrolipoyl transacylase) [Streptomyces sp. V3I8]|uniref:dihydrolipoamide acetyltransferase family protein n=1 Tax=Streptomyces sp. V3I8 TaxID=3042279 RepID=UPI00277DAFED|nr:dihydrolipoamide acetyltransferase family protein [Streptomyces sp. V3I8]MDQ1037538.1 2-oxoisovalerate dehydrogenase E2 component (dihydrolipoyl transacylase) [Streptomyces sp. V3I8]
MTRASDMFSREFRLPDLGEGLTEAEIVRWLVEVGDVVAVDQPVVEVETAKAMVEVPCPYGGVVTARYGDEGTELPVGSPLLTVAVGAPASDAQASDAQASSAPASSVPAPGATASGGRVSGARAPLDEDEGSGNVLVGYGTQAPAARRRRVRPPAPAATPGHRPPGPATGTDRAVTAALPGPATAAARPVRQERPLADPAAPGTGDRTDGPVPVISPLVRRLARENGLDLRELAGSGPDGLITRADVEHALQAGASAAPAVARPTRSPAPTSAPATAAPARATGTRVPLKGVRGAVADKLSRSRREIPDATCWVDADATELMRARTRMNEAGGPKISLLALLARVCTAALARFPELNSTVDTDAREVVRLDEVHLGFAAQTERGLVVPVVKGAHARNTESLSAEFARLTEAARTGSLTPADLTGGTFTLNNYGVFGVDGSTPIINHPEAAMLGVGRIVPKPWVHEGELAVRQVVQLSLTFDHRVCDGGTAGGFLRHVADCVEQPAVLLRTL